MGTHVPLPSIFKLNFNSAMEPGSKNVSKLKIANLLSEPPGVMGASLAKNTFRFFISNFEIIRIANI